MRSFAGLNEADPGFFGPGTDLVLSLVAVLVLVVFALNTDLLKLRSQRDEQGLDIEAVREAQREVIDAIAQTFDAEVKSPAPGTYEIQLGSSSGPDVVIKNEATLQRIRFGSHVLFDTDEYKLQPRGERILEGFARALSPHLNQIQEIHLEGHADTRKTTRYESNLVLASWRAMEVFQFLQRRGIDPTRHLMSATSFGEYDPVDRIGRASYNGTLLAAANDTKQERTLNRRIEVILVYTLRKSEQGS